MMVKRFLEGYIGDEEVFANEKGCITLVYIPEEIGINSNADMRTACFHLTRALIDCWVDIRNDDRQLSDVPVALQRELMEGAIPEVFAYGCYNGCRYGVSELENLQDLLKNVMTETDDLSQMHVVIQRWGERPFPENRTEAMNISMTLTHYLRTGQYIGIEKH